MYFFMYGYVVVCVWVVCVCSLQCECVLGVVEEVVVDSVDIDILMPSSHYPGLDV